MNKSIGTEAGVKWEFRPESGRWRPIQVPCGGWRAQGRACDAGTYRAWLDVPRNAAGRRVRVAFAAVNFGAEVFVGKDEKSLSKVASHVNGWLPFTADITPHVQPGERCLLTVDVKGRRKFMLNGKYLVPQGATWFEGLAEGIIRGIELQTRPPVFIEDAFVRTSVTDDCLHAEVTLRNATEKTVSVTLRSALRSASRKAFEYPALADAQATLSPGERRIVDLGYHDWGLGPESYWWPNVPYRTGYRSVLHNLDVTLLANAKPMHAVTQRFGFRQFAAHGPHYFLNGIRCNLHGDNQQEADFGTDAYGVFPGFGRPTAGNPGWPKAVDNLLRLNFNVMRIHQIPATPYMLDACDALGLMIVDETPLRGSEGAEDVVNGREHMLNAARELALRDRNHPSVVIWSAGNEIWNARHLVFPLQNAIQQVDDTRPVIVDGVSDFDPRVINMEHYISGLGAFPETGMAPRPDRPFGETEAIWPMDNTWQGLAWMATSTRLRRLKENADIRNYVLNNAWSNYVPGQRPALQILEKKVKNFTQRGGPCMEIRPPIRHPWAHPILRLMQSCYNPLTVCDIAFDHANRKSNDRGAWPVTRLQVMAGGAVVRELAIFNDEFEGEHVLVEWEVRLGGPKGRLHVRGRFCPFIPRGEHCRRNIRFAAPPRPGPFWLILRSSKDGRVRFVEDRIVFQVVP